MNIKPAGSIAALGIVLSIQAAYADDYVFTTLPTPAGATGIEPMGINDAGQIVGQTLANGSFSGGFVYSGGTYATFNVTLPHRHNPV
jgi:hypothetical protein